MCTTNERNGALQRMALEHGGQVVGQRVVDGCFNFTIKAQNTFAIFFNRSKFCIVSEGIGVPMRKCTFVLKVLNDRFNMRPVLTA